MRTISKRAYYERRAKSAIRKANMTADPVAKRVHLALAASCLKNAADMDKEPQVA